MYAVEFDAKITDGFIKIPSEYRELLDVENVRLVVMYDISKSLNDKKADINNSMIDFSQYNIESLKKINDPVKWQHTIRDEWN